MLKFGSICVVTGLLYAMGGALTADGQKNQVIPDFAPSLLGRVGVKRFQTALSIRC
jgi:hypothetical protein